MIVCLICGKILKNFNSLNNHIRGNHKNYNSKKYYDEFIKKPLENICDLDGCDNQTKFINMRSGYRKYCCVAHVNKSLNHRKAVSNRFMNKPEMLLSVQKTLRKRNSDVEYQKRVQSIRRETIKKRYNMSSSEFHRVKAFEQWKNKTDKERKEIGKKILETKKKNGTLYQFDNFKNSWKEIEIFGEIKKVQGFEPIVLEYLTKYFDFSSNDLFVGKDVPRFDYIYKDGKIHKYFPDIYLKNYRLIIEVKSTWTYKIFDKYEVKKKSVLDAGYNFLCFVVSDNQKIRKGQLESLKNILLEGTISSEAPKDIIIYGERSEIIS